MPHVGVYPIVTPPNCRSPNFGSKSLVVDAPGEGLPTLPPWLLEFPIKSAWSTCSTRFDHAGVCSGFLLISFTARQPAVVPALSCSGAGIAGGANFSPWCSLPWCLVSCGEETHVDFFSAAGPCPSTQHHLMVALIRACVCRDTGTPQQRIADA